MARSGSRSPRRSDETEAAAQAAGAYDKKTIEDTWEGEGEEEWEGDEPRGKNLGEDSFMGRSMSAQRAFLEQFLNPAPPPPGNANRAPRELAAGMPLEAARMLLLGCPDAVHWRGVSASHACIAAALHLFSQLLPTHVDPLAAGRICDSAREGPVTMMDDSAILSQQAFMDLAEASGLQAKIVTSAVQSLKAMVKNRPTVCCLFLEAYVGVLEDPESGTEIEQEVGAHCVMIVGGDVLGPNYVTFDPWGLAGGDVAYWSAHDAKVAAPLAWIELAPAGI